MGTDQLRHQLERRNVPRPHQGEMPPIRREDPYHAQPLGHGNDRGVHETERRIEIRRHEAGGAGVILRFQLFDWELTSRYVCQKALLCVWSNAVGEEIGRAHV